MKRLKKKIIVLLLLTPQDILFIPRKAKMRFQVPTQIENEVEE